MSLERQQGESLKEYKIRLCENKQDYSLTWDEVAALINQETGDSFGESTYRKWFSAFHEGQEYEANKIATSEDKLDEFTIKKLELQKERNKLQSEKLELNKWIREQARAENIAEKIQLAVENMEPIQIPEMSKSHSLNCKFKTAIVDIADPHYGREGKIYGLHGEVLAEYNTDIFEHRMWELLERTVEIIEKEKLSFIYVANLGDSLDGLLRLTQLQFLQLGVVESTMRFAEFMSHWLNKLSGYATVYYSSVTGNHSELRVGGIKSGEIKRENMELIIPWFIKERLKHNQNVVVYDAKPLHLIDALGTNVLLAHGQDEKNLENSIKDYSMIYQEQIHILKTGHLHHHSNKTIGMAGLQNVEYVQSPSICGIDEYSVKLKKTANAGSLITVFEEGYGKVCTYDIRLK
ncbi:hypothetical protein [Siminovitchia sp. 179-K 8D1 HS]|uniref:hypothetical protein n=1 Tax=Siminovitchia sp. 179-K 8D1 HS TaxID=3142385 RepID=UPI0039A0717E